MPEIVISVQASSTSASAQMPSCNSSNLPTELSVLALVFAAFVAVLKK